MPRKRKRSLRSQEFESRQHLGDLPEDILEERGELRRKIAAWPQVPPDIAVTAKVRRGDAERGTEGTVSQGADVRSTFDTRPINSRDFIFTNTLTILATS